MQPLTKTTVPLGSFWGPIDSNDNHVMEALMKWSVLNPAARIYKHVIRNMHSSNTRRPRLDEDILEYYLSIANNPYQADLDIYWQ